MSDSVAGLWTISIENRNEEKVKKKYDKTEETTIESNGIFIFIWF